MVAFTTIGQPFKKNLIIELLASVRSTPNQINIKPFAKHERIILFSKSKKKQKIISNLEEVRRKF
jgi:hypothetical protein